MENYHLFVTDENSLNFHIGYGFVGTGYSGSTFNIGIWKDIERLKIGDKIIFYVQNLKKFFGIFQVSSQPFFDIGNPLYLSAANPVLNVNGALSTIELRYRALVTPYEVYENGIEEFELVDILPIFTRDVLWSILYRKLKAKRGNSPLFPNEFAIIRNRLRAANQNNTVNYAGYRFDQGRISSGAHQPYTGRTARNCNVKQSILNQTYTEHHLHAVLIENLPNIVFGAHTSWIGNEIYSGAGMQAIDLMSINNTGTDEEYWPIEVKKGVVPLNIFDQIEKYCRWIAGRFALATPATTIQPVLVGLASSYVQRRNRATLKMGFDQLRISKPLKYIEYQIVAGRIQFDEIDLSSPVFATINRFTI